MKWKVSNTLFVVAVVIFALGVLFNWMQVKNSVESSLEKARRIKKEKAEARRKQEEEEEQDEINEEIIEIINNTENNGEK